MKLRLFLVSVLSAFLMTSAPTATAATRPAKPNLLWLVGEDFGQHLGCYVTREVWTPNLDRPAADGVRFTHFYNGMVCSVSRSAFMTGMYATTIGAHQHRTANKQPLPAGVRVLTDWMREAGYYTANVVELPASCGFNGSGKTDWNFKTQGKPFDTNRWADLKAHQPFYAQVNFQETHRAFRAPKKDQYPSRVRTKRLAPTRSSALFFFA